MYIGVLICGKRYPGGSEATACFGNGQIAPSFPDSRNGYCSGGRVCGYYPAEEGHRHCHYR
jgi:hypothetical protein